MNFQKTQEQALKVFENTFMQKIIDSQEELKSIYEDALHNSPEKHIYHVYSTAPHTVDERYVSEIAVFRRGFKVSFTPKTGMYEVFRTNTSDYYKHASDQEMNRFLKSGWIRACDEMQLERDRKLLAKFNKKIDDANEQRNDSLMVHWRKRRKELIDNISSIEESLSKL